MATDRKARRGHRRIKKRNGTLMSAKVIDGKAIAEDIYSSLAPKFRTLARPAKLGIVVVGANPIIESFVRIKTRAAERLGVEMVRVNVSEKSDSGKAEH